MTGERASKTCPTCGGSLHAGIANVPFILDETVVVIRGVPADICADCHEPFMAGRVTDQVMVLLNQLKALRSEVSVVSYSQYAATA